MSDQESIFPRELLDLGLFQEAGEQFKIPLLRTDLLMLLLERVVKDKLVPLIPLFFKHFVVPPTIIPASKSFSEMP